MDSEDSEDWDGETLKKLKYIKDLLILEQNMTNIISNVKGCEHEMWKILEDFKFHQNSISLRETAGSGPR